MKTEKLLGLLWMFLLAIALPACHDDDEEIIFNPEFSVKALEVPLRGSSTADVSANNEVTLAFTEPDIAEASFVYDENDRTARRYVYVLGLKKGETTLLLTDKLTEKTIELPVTVVDGYLPSSIIESNHPAFVKGDILPTLTNNEEQDFGLYTKSTFKYIKLGNYDFSTDAADGSDLTLTYATNEEGKFTTDENATLTAHRFKRLPESNEQSKYILNQFLGIVQTDMGIASYQSRMSPIEPPILYLQEIGTEYKVELMFHKILTYNQIKDNANR